MQGRRPARRAGVAEARVSGDLPSRRARLSALAPLLALILVLGVYPKPVLDMINPAVAATMQDAGQTDPPPAVTEAAEATGDAAASSAARPSTTRPLRRS